MTAEKPYPEMRADFQLYWRSQGRGRLGLFIRSTTGLHYSTREPSPVGMVVRGKDGCAGFVGRVRVCIVMDPDRAKAWEQTKDFVRARYLCSLLDSRLYVVRRQNGEETEVERLTRERDEARSALEDALERPS